MVGNWKKANAKEYPLGWNWRSITYLISLVLLLLVTSAFGYIVFFGSFEYDAYIAHGIYGYWLRHFSDVPGVKAYAEELLKNTHSTATLLYPLAIMCSAFPIILFATCTVSAVRRKFTKSEVAIVGISYFFWIVFLYLTVFQPHVID